MIRSADSVPEEARNLQAGTQAVVEAAVVVEWADETVEVEVWQVKVEAGELEVEAVQEVVMEKGETPAVEVERWAMMARSPEQNNSTHELRLRCPVCTNAWGVRSSSPLGEARRPKVHVVIKTSFFSQKLIHEKMKIRGVQIECTARHVSCNMHIHS